MKKFLLALCLILPVIFCCSGCDLFKTKTNQKYSVSVTTNMNEHCTIYGDGDYYEGAKFTIVVIPDEGYEFVQWSDGNTNNVIEKTKASKNETFTATIKKSITKYALDKVELYAVQNGTLIAKSVELLSFEIITTSNYKTITECDLMGEYGSINVGAKMIDYASYINLHKIRATQENPFVFYSPRNEENVFVMNESKSVYIKCSLYCHDGYINNGLDWVISYNHNEDITKEKTITVNNSLLTQTITFYTDSQHGYSLVSKLYFKAI